MARALVAESNQPLAAALARFLEGAGHEVLLARSAEEAVGCLSVRGQEPDVVLASTVGFPGEALCARVKAMQPRCPVVLLFAEGEENPAQRAEVVGAEGFLSLPPRQHQVRGTVALCLLLLGERVRAQDLERELAQAQSQAQAGVKHTESDFFKKYMVLEVKRSRRYHMPVAVVVAGLDGYEARPEVREPQTRSALKTEVTASLSELLRDVDIVMPMADDRFLVFLPNTPRDGALVVAGRVQAKLGALATLPDARATVGVVSFEPRQGERSEVTFGAMLHEAVALMQAAQAGGGARVVANPAEPKKRSRISIG